MDNEKSWLRDKWSVAGTTIEGFKDQIAMVNKHTSFVVVKPDELEFCYRLMADEGGDYYKIQAISPSRLIKFELQLAMYQKGAQPPQMHVGTAKKKNFDEALAEESFKNSGFVMSRDNKPLYMAESAKATLCMRAGVTGENAGRNSLFLTQAIVEALGRGKEYTLVVREDDKGNQKAFAFMSRKYLPIPQEILPSVIDDILNDDALGQAKVRGWFLDHQFTICHLEFPDAGADYAAIYGLKDAVIPGLVLMSSDTGASSLIIRGTYRMPSCKHHVILDEFAHKHVGQITASEILDAANNEIMAKFRRLPEALAAKVTKIIGTGLTATTRDMSKNEKAVQNAYKQMLAKTGVKKELGAARTKQLYEMLCMGIDPAQVYTEYDVATTIMGLADRVDGLSREMQARLAKACGKAPFVSLTDKKEEEEPELVLLPEGA